MKPEYIKRFEKLGVGLFVHFGLYSNFGIGEWTYKCSPEEDLNASTYFEDGIKRFKIKEGWAKELVATAKLLGAKYITLTTRHHEGFSLYDTKGLSDFDVMHSPTKRDLIKEFVDECNKEGIIPFFYHTLLDWHHPDYDTDFPKYLQYLRDSVELLCTNYGKIGGLWFDGSWSKPTLEVWEFPKLYEVIRKHQPEAMIINNTGMCDRGAVGNEEIDSVTFERGKPTAFKSIGEKEIAGEMCDGINDHWGYTADDVNYKSIPHLINSLIDCRRFNCNYLINTGLMGDGSVNLLDRCLLEGVGRWIRNNKEFIYNIKAADVDAENAFMLQDNEYYYAVIKDVPMIADPHVAMTQKILPDVVVNCKKILSAEWLDNGHPVELKEGTENQFAPKAFRWGHSMAARVVRMKIEK